MALERVRNSGKIIPWDHVSSWSSAYTTASEVATASPRKKHRRKRC